MAQAISQGLDIFGLAAVVAGVASLVIAAIGQKCLPANVGERFVLPVAVAIGFLVGFSLLPRDFVKLTPEQSRDWLPYVGLAAAVAGSAAAGFSRAVRWAAACGAIALTGWLLTPDWPIFGLARPASIGILCGYLVLLFAALETLPPRGQGKSFALLLAFTAAVLAAGVGAYYSEKFARLAAIAATSLAGCFVAGWLCGKNTEQAAGGLRLTYVVLVGGAAFVACVDPEQPLIGFLAIPFIPLAIWGATLARRVPFAKVKNG